MKGKIILILILISLLLCVAACGKQVGSSTEDELRAEKDIVQAEDAEGAETKETAGGFDIERVRKNVIIKDQPFEIPTALSELGEGWTWEEDELSSWGVNGSGLVDVYFNNEEWFVGGVENYYAGSEDEGIIYNLTIETGDCSIDGFVPLESTRQEMLERYGEPMETDDKYGLNYHYGSLHHDSGVGPSREQSLSVTFDENDIITSMSITYYVDVVREGVNSYDINEILSDLTIEGVKIGWPCDLEDIQKVFELGDVNTFESDPDIVLYDLYLEGHREGQVWISQEKSFVLSLSLDYLFDNGAAIEFKGVTEKSSYSDVIRMLGEPTYYKEHGYYSIFYQDTSQDIMEAHSYDEIDIGFSDDCIRSIVLRSKMVP